MNQKELSELIYRQKNGTATPEEIARLEAFWEEMHSSEAFLTDHTPQELDRVGKEMYKNIEVTVRDASHDAKGRPFWDNPIYRAAAMLLVLMSISLWFYANWSPMTEIRTDFGERRTVLLPDRSTVVLNGNSVIRYASVWEHDSQREVWIEGEGFFSVTHQQNNQKFVVHSDQLNVEVLGTKFNVKARPCASEVMLTEGKVKLGLAKDTSAASMVLTPGEVAFMNSEGLSKRTARKEYFTGWVENKLFFDRTTLREIAQILKETHGLEVRFEDPGLEKRELSGEISSATEEEILIAVTESFNLQFTREGRSVTISAKVNHPIEPN